MPPAAACNHADQNSEFLDLPNLFWGHLIAHHCSPGLLLSLRETCRTLRVKVDTYSHQSHPLRCYLSAVGGQSNPLSTKRFLSLCKFSDGLRWLDVASCDTDLSADAAEAELPAGSWQKLRNLRCHYKQMVLVKTLVKCSPSNLTTISIIARKGNWQHAGLLLQQLRQLSCLQYLELALPPQHRLDEYLAGLTQLKHLSLTAAPRSQQGGPWPMIPLLGASSKAAKVDPAFWRGAIAPLTQLTGLQLGLPLTGVSQLQLQALSGLQQLQVCLSKELVSDLIEELTALQGLTCLAIDGKVGRRIFPHGAQTPAVDLQPLRQLTSLKELQLNLYCTMDVASLQPLQACKQLTQLGCARLQLQLPWRAADLAPACAAAADAAEASLLAAVMAGQEGMPVAQVLLTKPGAAHAQPINIEGVSDVTMPLLPHLQELRVSSLMGKLPLAVLAPGLTELCMQGQKRIWTHRKTLVDDADLVFAGMEALADVAGGPGVGQGGGGGGVAAGGVGGAAAAAPAAGGQGAAPAVPAAPAAAGVNVGVAIHAGNGPGAIADMDIAEVQPVAGQPAAHAAGGAAAAPGDNAAAAAGQGAAAAGAGAGAGGAGGAAAAAAGGGGVFDGLTSHRARAAAAQAECLLGLSQLQTLDVNFTQLCGICLAAGGRAVLDNIVSLTVLMRGMGNVPGGMPHMPRLKRLCFHDDYDLRMPGRPLSATYCQTEDHQLWQNQASITELVLSGSFILGGFYESNALLRAKRQLPNLQRWVFKDCTDLGAGHLAALMAIKVSPVVVIEGATVLTHNDVRSLMALNPACGVDIQWAAHIPPHLGAASFREMQYMGIMDVEGPWEVNEDNIAAAEQDGQDFAMMFPPPNMGGGAAGGLFAANFAAGPPPPAAAAGGAQGAAGAAGAVGQGAAAAGGGQGAQQQQQQGGAGGVGGPAGFAMHLPPGLPAGLAAALQQLGGAVGAALLGQGQGPAGGGPAAAAPGAQGAAAAQPAAAAAAGVGGQGGGGLWAPFALPFPLQAHPLANQQGAAGGGAAAAGQGAAAVGGPAGAAWVFAGPPLAAPHPGPPGMQQVHALAAMLQQQAGPAQAVNQLVQQQLEAVLQQGAAQVNAMFGGGAGAAGAAGGPAGPAGHPLAGPMDEEEQEEEEWMMG